MEIFPSQYIHIGGDDQRPLKTCPDCQKKKKEGLKGVNELQGYFIKRIEKFIISKK
jgi:hexosaminidase